MVEHIRLGDMMTVGVLFVVTGIMLGMGSKILYNIQSSVGNGTTAYYAVGNATESIGTLSSWLPTVAIIVAAAIIIGVLFSSFFGFRREK